MHSRWLRCCEVRCCEEAVGEEAGRRSRGVAPLATPSRRDPPLGGWMAMRTVCMVNGGGDIEGSVEGDQGRAVTRMVVGLCTYNRGAKIVPTLEAMARLDRAGGRVTEAVIVDKKSTDDTAKGSDEFIARNTGLPMRRVHEATPGKSAAMVRLFNETNEPLIAMLDDDTLPDV